MNQIAVITSNYLKQFDHGKRKIENLINRAHSVFGRSHNAFFYFVF